VAKKIPKPAELSPAQHEIMEIVWEQGEVSVSEVHEILASKRDVARNTIRTLMDRMDQKGWLIHRERRNQFLYSAAIPRQTSIGRKVLDLLNSVCGGSPEALITALLNHRGLSEDECQRIENLLDASKKKSTKGKKP
jgi:BlaI family penicillinase repressor